MIPGQVPDLRERPPAARSIRAARTRGTSAAGEPARPSRRPSPSSSATSGARSRDRTGAGPEHEAREDYPVRRGGGRRACSPRTEVNLEIERRKTSALVGESGSGKTTVARCVLRLEEPTGGEVLLDGEPITGVTAPELRRPPRDADGLPGPARLAQPAAHASATWSPSRSGAPDRAAGESRAEVEACSRWSVSAPRHVDRCRTSSRAASSSGSGSPGRWHAAPSWWSSTSRRRRSTCPSRPRSSTCSATCKRDRGLAYLFVSHDLGVVAFRPPGRRDVPRSDRRDGAKGEVLQAPFHPYTRGLIGGRWTTWTRRRSGSRCAGRRPRRSSRRRTAASSAPAPSPSRCAPRSPPSS